MKPSRSRSRREKDGAVRRSEVPSSLRTASTRSPRRGVAGEDLEDTTPVQDGMLRPLQYPAASNARPGCAVLPGSVPPRTRRRRRVSAAAPCGDDVVPERRRSGRVLLRRQANVPRRRRIGSLGPTYKLLQNCLTADSSSRRGRRGASEDHDRGRNAAACAARGRGQRTNWTCGSVLPPSTPTQFAGRQALSSNSAPSAEQRPPFVEVVVVVPFRQHDSNLNRISHRARRCKLQQLL
jgi:hypothetical protein